MRKFTVLSAAVFAIATAFLTAPSALAGYTAIGIDDKGDLKAGQEVRVSASCYDGSFTRSTVVSTALVSGDLVSAAPKHSSDRVLFTMARIKPGLKPGTYSLSFICAEREVVGKFTVVADKPKTSPKPAAQVPVKPKGAADTGGGDVVQATEPAPDLVAAAAPAPPAESNTGVLVLGGAGVLALGGAAALGYRRFRRQS